MESSFSMGGLIPLWILGAPFVAAVVSLLRMPKRTQNGAREQREARGAAG